MRASIRRQLDESGTVFYTDADINEAIDAGYDEISDATEFFERQANIPLLKRRTYFDMTTNLSDTFLSPRRAYHPTTNRWLSPSDTREMDFHTYTQWELTEGSPQKMLMRGNWWLGIFPKETADIGVIRLYYTSIPDAMEDSAEPAFPKEFHPGIIEFVLSDLLGQARETKKSLSHWAAYIGYQDGLKSYVEGRTRLAKLNVL